MATRSNIIIKKNGCKTAQMYHHYDGYPEGVGAMLHTIFYEDNYKGDNVTLKGKTFKTPTAMAKAINEIDENFEVEKCNKYSLHYDIEYLYIIDMDKNMIVCYGLRLWDFEGDNRDIWNDTLEEDEKLNIRFILAYIEVNGKMLIGKFEVKTI